MKISELIKKLSEIEARCGDVEVITSNGESSYGNIDDDICETKMRLWLDEGCNEYYKSRNEEEKTYVIL